MSVRFNPAKLPGHNLPAISDPVPWCGVGAYLPGRPPFTLMPELHQGLFYVQEAASMFIHHVVSHLVASCNRPLLYLDACAAPGGKTTAAISALPAGSIVVANEYVASRADILRENLAKWGYPLTRVTQGDVSRFSPLGTRFDIVAADVPCSGEGMMRKDPKAVEQWSPALVDQCAARQHTIVSTLWDTVAPGGYLIYSTCTYSREENEAQLHHLVDTLGAIPIAIPVHPSWGLQSGIDTPYPCHRFIPGATRGEGLFMAVVQKPVDSATHTRRAKAPAGPRHDRTLSSQCASWLTIPAVIAADPRGRVIAYPEADTFPGLPAELRPAIHIADIKGRKLQPTVELILSTAFRPGTFPTAELTYPQALDYLRGQAVTLPADTPRGPVTLTYRTRPLGLVNNVGNRANNLHPAPWRILTPATPEVPPSLIY